MGTIYVEYVDFAQLLLFLYLVVWPISRMGVIGLYYRPLFCPILALPSISFRSFSWARNHHPYTRSVWMTQSTTGSNR